MLLVKKNTYYQMIRGICICAVVLIHCPVVEDGITYQNIFEFNSIYFIIFRNLINFPVPVFLFLAGYFTNTTHIEISSKAYLVKRLKRLLIPYIVFATFYTCLDIIPDIIKRETIDYMNVIVNFLTGGVSQPTTC